MKRGETYKSVHEYMDALFKNTIPSDNDIKEAKQAYRKYYLKKYREAYDKNHIQITFRISKKQYQLVKQQAEKKEIKVTTLAKQRALQIHNSDNIKIKIQLSELLDYIEECIYENRVLDPISILKQLETIEQQL